ncbi:MAG: prevent-host-death protein [Burkholderiales bacterium]|nr:prevent-host-death protein [Burkholderiales bacterium]
MTFVDLMEAVTTLPRLVEAIESGAETEVIISRNGEPAARLIPVEQPPYPQRIGVAVGRLVVPEDIDGADDEIAESLAGDARLRPAG